MTEPPQREPLTCSSRPSLSLQLHLRPPLCMVPECWMIVALLLWAPEPTTTPSALQLDAVKELVASS